MSSGGRAKPKWRSVFDTVERSIGAPLEEVASSESYVDVIVRGMKMQRAVGGAIGRATSGVTSKLLHGVGLPTRRDVRRLSTQLTTLTGEVRALKTALADADRTPQGSRTRGGLNRTSGDDGGRDDAS